PFPDFIMTRRSSPDWRRISSPATSMASTCLTMKLQFFSASISRFRAAIPWRVEELDVDAPFHIIWNQRGRASADKFVLGIDRPAFVYAGYVALAGHPRGTGCWSGAGDRSGLFFSRCSRLGRYWSQFYLPVRVLLSDRAVVQAKASRATFLRRLFGRTRIFQQD